MLRRQEKTNWQICVWTQGVLIAGSYRRAGGPGAQSLWCSRTSRHQNVEVRPHLQPKRRCLAADKWGKRTGDPYSLAPYLVSLNLVSPGCSGTHWGLAVSLLHRLSTARTMTLLCWFLSPICLLSKLLWLRHSPVSSLCPCRFIPFCPLVSF